MAKRDKEELYLILRSIKEPSRKWYDMEGLHGESYDVGWSECWDYFKQELECLIKE